MIDPPKMFGLRPVESRVRWVPDRGPLEAKEGYWKQLYSPLLAQWLNHQYLGQTLESDS